MSDSVSNDYKVSLDVFEGPLDLLLHLVKKHDIPIFEVPVAFITLLPEERKTVTAASLGAFCKERLAGYKLPEIRIVDALPMTATGKVKKEELSQFL